MPFLRVLKGEAGFHEVELTADEVIIGRDPQCAILLDCPEVSRRHASLVGSKDAWRVTDLDSRNKTLVNSRVLEPKVPHALANNDLITICDFTFGFYEGPESSRSQISNSTIQLVDDEDGSEISSVLDSSFDQVAEKLENNAAAKLRAILQLIRSIHSVVDVDAVLDKVADQLLASFPSADGCAIALYDLPHSTLMESAVRSRSQPESSRHLLSRAILEYAMTTRQAVISVNPLFDERFSMSDSIMQISSRSVLCAPLIARNGIGMGAVQLQAASGRRFGTDDLELISTLACQAADSIENVQLQETVRRQTELEKELEIAQTIQLGLLPAGSPVVEGYDFCQYYMPARHIGGDYYDYVMIDDYRLAIVVADAEGHGIPAAMLMSKLAGEVKVYLAQGLSPGTVLTMVNRNFARLAATNLATMLLVDLNLREHNMRLAIAGHPRPILRKENGDLIELGEDHASYPFGVMDDVEYAECRFGVEAGDLLTIYTDGVTELANPQREPFGTTRLKQALALDCRSPRKWVDHVTRDMQAFAGGCEQRDDVCLLCVYRAAKPSD